MNNKKTPLMALVMETNTACLDEEAIKVGCRAPNFTLPPVQDGHAVSLQDFLGKVIYLFFWASWCKPSLEASLSLVNFLRNKLAGLGFEVIAICQDDNISKANESLQDISLNFPVVFDGTGECAEHYSVETLPTSFLIDKRGVVRHIHYGFKANDIYGLETKILELLVQ